MSELLRDIPNEQEEQETTPDFIVDDDAKAEWCLRKIREAKADLEKWKAHYAAQMKRIEDSANFSIAKFELMLRDYFLTLQEGGLVKQTKIQQSYPLQTGKLVLKHQEPKYDVNDEELVPWLKKHDPSLVKVKESANWDSLKKQVARFGSQMVTEDGEVVPGVTATEREDVFKVEVK